ncbi:DUF4349 domain-containing protein [Actinophytocola sp.]|uniref:DUF4349 domain-containing protein n=1 Tax=Actinophytocola sp. TaxID=1872138 RepID=UPI002ED3EBEA
MNRKLVGVALLLGVSAGLASACSSTNSGSSTAMAPLEAPAAGDAGGSKSTGQGQGAGVAENKEISQPGVDRKLVRTATLELAAADVGAAVDRARTIATTEGGYTGREEVGKKSATLTLHIPSDRFDQALGDLSELGEVISRNQTADDVTEQVVDLESRIATQRASVDRVRALLARAGTVEEIVRIESELTTREADLESLEQRRQALAGQVAMSTVNVQISGSAAAVEQEDESSGFLTGLSDGWDAFLDAGAVTLQVLGAVLPFLFVLAIPAVLVIRFRRRRRPAAAPVAPQ